MSGPPPGPGLQRPMSVGTGPPSAGMPPHGAMAPQQGSVPPPAGPPSGPQSQQNLNQIVGYFYYRVLPVMSFTALAVDVPGLARRTSWVPGYCPGTTPFPGSHILPPLSELLDQLTDRNFLVCFWIRRWTVRT